MQRPLKRYGVKKSMSARRFRGQVSRTKGANLNKGLARGGWRL